jgi:cyclohexyl-isocyanide hydratase
METNRRALLQGFAGATLLAPWIAASQALASEAGGAAAAPATQMSDEHMEAMAKVIGPGIWAQEEVAMLLYPKFTALDFVGPHYFFASMYGAKVHLVTTEADLSPVASDLGLAITPTITMAGAPKDLDVLFIPGGAEGTLSVMSRADAIGWVKDRAARAKHITSVCTGSMVLAKAGLLQGRKATSHWSARPVLKDFGAIPVDERVVRDGNILTGAGVSAGIDFAIALVEMLRGKPYAEALVLMAEYAPQPPVDSGTLSSAPADVGQMMNAMFAPLAEQFRALAAK